MVILYSGPLLRVGRPHRVEQMSVRAARADASIKHGANDAPDGDYCLTCCRTRTKLTADDFAKAAAARHGLARVGRSYRPASRLPQPKNRPPLPGERRPDLGRSLEVLY